MSSTFDRPIELFLEFYTIVEIPDIQKEEHAQIDAGLADIEDIHEKQEREYAEKQNSSAGLSSIELGDEFVSRKDRNRKVKVSKVIRDKVNGKAMIWYNVVLKSGEVAKYDYPELEPVFNMLYIPAALAVEPVETKPLPGDMLESGDEYGMP